MSEAILTCTNCKQELFEQLARSEPPQRCPNCDHQIWLALFPAWYSATEAKTSGSQSIVNDEASCFFHERKQAVASCEECGRFVCSLCEIQIGDRQICPRCLEKGAEKGRIVDLERQRTRYDLIVETLALLSLLFFLFSPVLAGIGIGLALWKWKAPGSRVTNSRWVMSFALVLLILEFLGGLALWYAVYAEI